MRAIPRRGRAGVPPLGERRAVLPHQDRRRGRGSDRPDVPRAGRGQDRIDGGDNVKAYLFAVARRVADHFRKRSRAPAIDRAVSSLVDLGSGPATRLGAQQRRELLRDGLARIPLDDQIALELAGVLEIPENTVRSRLSRARDKLRAVLRELGTPEEAELADSQLGDR